MSATNWDLPQSASAVARRAGGRRHYNATRTAAANLRRWDAVKLLAEIGLERGCQAELSRRLGVSRSTISRDFQLIDESIRISMPIEEIEVCNRIRARIDRQEARRKQVVGE